MRVEPRACSILLYQVLLINPTLLCVYAVSIYIIHVAHTQIAAAPLHNRAVHTGLVFLLKAGGTRKF